MKHAILLLTISANLIACGKESIPATTIPCCENGVKGESCDTVPHRYELIWHTPFHSKSGRSVSSTPIIHGNTLVTSFLAMDEDYSILEGFNATTGDKIWTWSNYDFGQEFLHDKYTQFQFNNDLIFSFVDGVYNINPITGHTNWSTSKQSNNMKTLPSITIIGNYFYYGSISQSDQDFQTYLFRQSVISPSKSELIYELTDTTGVNLIFSLPTMYFNKFNDTCLVFIGKGYHTTDPSKGKTVFHAINLNTKTKLWHIEFVGGDGLSMPPIIIGSKIIVAPTSTSVACLDATTGDLIWQKELPDKGFMQTGNMVIEEGVLLVLNNMGSLYAFHPETGEELWKQQTAEWASSPVKMEAHKGILYVANGGLGCQLSAWDVHTGENYWCEYSVNAICKPDCFISSSGLTIDKERGLLYTTDGYDILCIKTIR